jgi:hypothetical protein
VINGKRNQSSLFAVSPGVRSILLFVLMERSIAILISGASYSAHVTCMGRNVDIHFESFGVLFIVAISGN